MTASLFVRSDDQDAVAETLGRLLSKVSSTERVRAAEPLGFDIDVWHALSDLGLFDAAASGDASLADLAVAAEQCGRFLAPAPFVEAIVVARCLGRVPERSAVFAPRPARDGVARLVPGGAVSDYVVALHGDALVESPAAWASDTRKFDNSLGFNALADVDVSAGTTVGTVDDFERALDDWRVLTASALAGLARAALDIGVGYVKERNQFGVPIGTFQSIQHRLADLHTAVDGAALLAREAAIAIVAGDDDAPALAVMALAWAGQVAEDAANASLHFHGGYGFMLEYDIQMYVRRAKAWRLAAGDPRIERVLLADRLWGDGRRGLDRGFEPDIEAFRQEVRQFVAEHVTDEIIERAHTTGTMHDWGLHRALAERGWLAAGWPVEVGGLGRSPVETTVLMQEVYGSGAPVDGMGIASMVAATLLLRGNDRQRDEVVPRILAGEVLCCLGYSEPDAGSDVAAVQTRAVPAEDGSGDWIVNGQKMFTTMAHEASYVLLLTRTDPSKPKHRGLTMFLVPMDLDGIEITPVHTLGGERTNITFYTDVRVPDWCRVGDVDLGWSVMHAALVFERNSANWGEPDRLVRDAAAWAVQSGALDDPLVAERLAQHATTMEVGRLLLYRGSYLAADGVDTPIEGSMAKLFLTESFTRATADVLDIMGAAGVLPSRFEHAYRHATVTTIYGGSSEIQRGIVAEHGLGLPRTR